MFEGKKRKKRNAEQKLQENHLGDGENKCTMVAPEKKGNRRD